MNVGTDLLIAQLTIGLSPAVPQQGEPTYAAKLSADDRKFADVKGFQSLIAAHPGLLFTNLAQQLAVYSTGREVAFSDRPAIAAVVAETQKKQGGVRTLLLELVQSPLFRTR